MRIIRKTARDYRHLALLVAVMSLAVKALLPAGYMLANETRVLTVLICADASHQGWITQGAIIVQMKGTEHTDDSHKSDGSCPYSALAMTALGGAPALLLELALVFILALAFAPIRLPDRKSARRLWPPLRGPPLMATPLIRP